MFDSFETKSAKVMAVARSLFAAKPDYVKFYQEVLGVHGSARAVFTNDIEYQNFRKSEDGVKIDDMIDELRFKARRPKDTIKVITVRIPEAVHDSLKFEAHHSNVSMNKLCLLKLMKAV